MPTHAMLQAMRPMAPCCRNCHNLMSFKEMQPWTLLRGAQLGRLTFECHECGSTSTRIAAQAHLAA